MTKLYLPVCWLVLLSPAYSYAQYCTAVGPSTNADSELQSFNLTGESATSISFTGCPGVFGLDDQTANESVVLNAGAAYTAYAQFGTCGGNYSGVGQGWIDYNQNSVFEASESIGTWTGMPPSAPVGWGFTVPASAVSGTTRMRVVHYEGGFLPIDPCATFTWGSTTDFTVQIGGGMDCSGYLGQNMGSPRPVSSLPYLENYNNSVCYYNLMTVYNSPDVYYRILPQQLGAQFITVSLCGSTIDTYLSILDDDGNVLWYNDDNASCGGTSSKIHFNAGTHDTLFVVVQGWGSQTGDYSISIEEELAGLNETGSITEFKLSPNPATEQVFVKADVYDGFLRIYDIAGKEVYASDFKGSEMLDVSAFAPGTYQLTLTSEFGVFTQKLVVQ